ncbi:hypothetical protein VTO42DRAFT_1737 [Malbranchea cinnamomea]
MAGRRPGAVLEHGLARDQSDHGGQHRARKGQSMHDAPSSQGGVNRLWSFTYCVVHSGESTLGIREEDHCTGSPAQTLREEEERTKKRERRGRKGEGLMEGVVEIAGCCYSVRRRSSVSCPWPIAALGIVDVDGAVCCQEQTHSRDAGRDEREKTEENTKNRLKGERYDMRRDRKKKEMCSDLSCNSDVAWMLSCSTVGQVFEVYMLKLHCFLYSV